MKQKLLIATDSFLPRWDGITRFLTEIIPRLQNTYDITILAPDFQGKSPKLNVKVIRFPLTKLTFGDITFSKPKLKQLKDEIKNADLVWTQTIGPIGIPSIYFAKKYKKPSIAYIHSIDWELTSKAVRRFKNSTKFVTKKLAKYLYNKTDLLLVPSLEVANLFKKLKIKPYKTIIHLGTDTNKFKPANKDTAKAKLGISKETTVIGYCGRIGREKDLKTLYKAFAKLQEKYYNLLLLLVGGGVKEQTEFFKEKKGVKLTGSINNVIPYLQAMDIYVLPSLTETTSLSTMEAMSVGLPVVTTKVGLVKEYIKPGENGLFFVKKHSYSLRVKLEKILNNKTLEKKLGDNARKTIIHHYSWKKTVEEIEKALSAF